MRIRILVPAFLVLAIALICIIFKRPTNKLALDADIKAMSNTANLPSMGLIAKGTNISMTMAQRDLATADNPSRVDRNDPESIRKFMESANIDIDFFGKIVDQDGNPLANATVKGEALHLKVIVPAPFGDQDEIIRFERQTDLDGRFEVRGINGRDLQIETVQKDHYEVEPDICPHSFGASIGAYGKPVIFKMWNTNIHEQLITGDRKFPILPDGNPYFIDLSKGEISQSESGDLKVWVKYPEHTEFGKKYEWSCEIDVIHGGLQAGESYSMFSAPADGYVPRFALQQQIRDGQSGSIGDKRFYVMLNNGKLFGKIQIDLIAPFNTGIPGLIRLSYAINPSGSRILR